MIDDATLVARAQTGDAAAMNTLLERHYDRIHAVCRRVTGSAADADDAAQEAMIKIVRAIGTFDGRSQFSTWCYRIATNVSLDELRRRGRRPQLHTVRPGADEEPPEPVDDRAERDVVSPVNRLVVEQAIASLPIEFRTPLVMRDVGDLDYSEIAAALGIPIGTVKSRIARGRRQLVEFLGESSGESGSSGNRDPGSRRPTDVPPGGPSPEQLP